MIANLAWTGHHLHFASLLCRSVREAGHTPVLVTPRGTVAAREYSVYAAEGSFDGVELNESDPIDSYKGVISGIRASKRILADTARWVKRTRCDRLWLHFADQLTNAVYIPGAARLEVPCAALHLRGGYAYPTNSLRSRAVYAYARQATLQAPWDHLWHLDHLAHQVLRERSQRIALMPEPVESPLSITQVDARRELGLPIDDRLLMVLGALDSRKGVVELMRAFRDAAPYRTRLVLMGLLYPDVKDAVMSLSNELGIERCIVRDVMLSQRDFSLGFAASDWQALPYRQHIGSSGILVRAAAYGRPVLASDWGWIGQATQQFGLGSTCDTSSNESIVEGIHRLVAAPTLASAQANRFANFNTEHNFCAHWSRTLEGEIGVPNPAYLPWS